jgi:imidazolonepropionase
MLPSEAIVASTINAAHAVSRANEAGSIEVGKKADIIIMDVHDYNLIPQHIGDGILESVIKGGKIIF